MRSCTGGGVTLRAVAIYFTHSGEHSSARSRDVHFHILYALPAFDVPSLNSRGPCLHDGPAEAAGASFVAAGFKPAACNTFNAAATALSGSGSAVFCGPGLLP